MLYRTPLIKRLLAKLIHDVLPAVLASVIGGFLFTHFQLGWATAPVSAQVSQASPEMMQLLRDEHGLIVNFLRAQLANEQKQATTEDSEARVADAEPAAPIPTPRPAVVAVAAAKPAPPRGKNPVVSASLPPPVIAQAQKIESAKPAGRSEDSLVATTIGFKDHVFAVTHGVVSAISGLPSLIGSIGDRIGGEDASPRPPASLISAS